MHQTLLPDWALERGRAMNHFTEMDPAKTALVVIDMQNVFLDPAEVFGNPNALDIIPTVNRLAAAMREAGCPIIWTRQTVATEPPLAMPTWQYDLSIPDVARAVAEMEAGTRAHALHPDMAVADGDIVLDKYRYGAFMCPAGNLARALKEAGAGMIVIAGTLTNCCCDSTARDANMAGYKVIAVADAQATRTDEEHNAALLTLCLNFADVRMTDEVIAMAQAG